MDKYTKSEVKLDRHLDKVEQASEPPGHGVEPLGAGVRPAGVHQLSQVPVGEEAGPPPARWVVLLGDVTGGEVTDAQEVTSTLNVALLLGGEAGQTRCSQALLGALPSCIHHMCPAMVKYLILSRNYKHGFTLTKTM